MLDNDDQLARNGEVNDAFQAGRDEASREAAEIVTSLLDYMDRHRVSWPERDDGTRSCGCKGDCFEWWTIEREHATRWVGEATGDG